MFRRVTRVSDRLLVYSPPPSVPGNLHLRSLNALVHALAWRELRRAVPVLERGAVDVLVGWPPAFELARRLRPRRLIYDCLDLFPAFADGLRHRLLASLEADLVRAASTVVVTSRDLERRWSGRHPRVVRIPNGVDLALFGCRPGPAAVPADIADLPHPRLGYVGTVGRWVDVSLLEHVARQRPQCSVVVVGPVERGVTRPSGPANLRVLGERPYASLPDYLAAFDVLLIPFRLTGLTHAVNPIKLYEYCTTGKPIVATPIAEVLAERELCHLGETATAFVEAVDDALDESARPDPARAAARRAFALRNGWERRVADFASLLDEPDAPS